MMKKILLAIFCFTMLVSLNAEAFDSIGIDVAHTLARSCLNIPKYKKGALDYSSSNPENNFYIFQGIGKVSNFGWIAVNAWTGDVWNMNECKRLSSLEARMIQARIKKQFYGDERNDYQRLHELRPYRMSDLEPCH